MTHWWNPKTWVMLKELEILQKRAAKLEAYDLPVPGSLKMKIQELETKLAME